MEIKYDKKGRLVIPKCFPGIMRDDLKPLDVLIFYNESVKKFKAAWWARYHGRQSKKSAGRVTNPPNHANIVYDIGAMKAGGLASDIFLADTEIRTTLSHIEEYTEKSNIRIDVIRYYSSNSMQKLSMHAWLKKATKEEHFYDGLGYGGFIREMPWYFSWAGYLMPKPSNKNYFCSDLVASCFASQALIVSDKKPNETAPRDLIRWAMGYDVGVDIFTLKLAGEVF